MFRHHLQLRVDVHQPEVRQNLAEGFAGAGLFLGDFLELEVVDQPALLDQRQQWI